MEQKKRLITPSQEYTPGQLVPHGISDVMCFQQYCFPNKMYTEKDTLLYTNSMVLDERDREQYVKCLVNHTGDGPMKFEHWALTATAFKVFKLLEDLFQINANEKHTYCTWTGYRLSGGIENGVIVWHFELFAKNENSKISLKSTKIT